MTQQTLKQLLTKWADFVQDTDHPTPPIYEGEDVTIHRIIEDSRIVQAGDCFIARVRPYSNGHAFVPKAIANGASLIVVQDGEKLPPLSLTNPPHIVLSVPNTAVFENWLAGALYDFPAQHLTTIGVTGTDGKTSICNILYHILRASKLDIGLISTIRAVIGGEEEPTGLHVTTPQAPETQALLRRMVDAGMSHVILEMTSMGLAEHRADCAFVDVGVVSNITHEHLDYHGSFEQYTADKGRLFGMASQFSVLNRDDGSYDALASLANGTILRYGIDMESDFSAENITFSAQKTTFDLIRPDGIVGLVAVPIDTALVGKFNISNILAAAAVGYGLGLDDETIARGITSIEGISGRMERIDEGQEPLVIVDFAHTPNGLLHAISAAREMTDGRIITVFGSAGRRDVAKRRLMAEISAEGADITVLTAEDPRNEPVGEILQMMVEGGVSKGGILNQSLYAIPDRGRAIAHAIELATTNDIVLICGKGHEQSMCFDGIEYPWDDRTSTRKILQAILSNHPMPDSGLPTF